MENKHKMETYSYKPNKTRIDRIKKLIKNNPILIKRLEDA